MSLERIVYPKSYFLSTEEILEQKDKGNVFGTLDEFQKACADGDSSKVNEMLANKSGKLHSLTPAGYSPLDIAVHAGKKDIVEALIASGVDVNFHAPANTAGSIAIAVGRDDEAMVDVLLSAGANLSGIDANGRTLVSTAIFNRNIDLAKKLINAGAPIDVYSVPPQPILASDSVLDATAATGSAAETISDATADESAGMTAEGVAPAVTTPAGSALHSAALREDAEAVGLVLPHVDLRLVGASALVALAATADDARAAEEGSAFQLIFRRMVDDGVLDVPVMQEVILHTIRGRKMHILRAVVEAAVTQHMSLLNVKMDIPDSFVFLWVRFKTAKKTAFQQLFGAPNTTVRAYPACAAAIAGWNEAVELLMAPIAADAVSKIIEIA